MPVILLETTHLHKEQKEQLVKEFTETASRILHLPASAIIVYLKENAAENIGAGGKLLSET
ncbi:4-oxalocrotonate tautomerase DmpI [Agathobaculum sp. Marseille-P7918]|uniref:4-oxalocrotonate tautomerase DmpI n=1 Tax=Agathobaculum sp. Marseille-P7918 TaxID=2479843 RepID=UPI003567A8FD